MVQNLPSRPTAEEGTMTFHNCFSGWTYKGQPATEKFCTSCSIRKKGLYHWLTDAHQLLVGAPKTWNERSLSCLAAPSVNSFNINSNANCLSLHTPVTPTNHSHLAPLIPDFFRGPIDTLQIYVVVFSCKIACQTGVCVFDSNGDLDPWSAGGVLESPSPSLISIVIKDAAHHLDLRSSNPNDTAAVIAARNKEKAVVRRWLRQYWNKPRSTTRQARRS